MIKRILTLIMVLATCFSVHAQQETKFAFRTDSTTVQLNGIEVDTISTQLLSEIDTFRLVPIASTDSVVSFRFVFAPTKGEAAMQTCLGDKLKDWSSNYIRNASPGDRILFDKIKITTGGEEKMSGHLVYEIR